MNQVPPPPPPPPPGGPGGPGGGYVGPPAGAGSADAYSIGEAFSYAFSKVGTNFVALLVSVLGLVAAGVVSWVISIILATVFDSFAIVQLLSSAVNIVLATLGGYPLYRTALAISGGASPAPGYGYDFSDVGVFFVPALISGLITGVAIALCCLPAFFVFPFMMFAPYVALDQKLGGWNAVQAGIDMAKKNAGPAILFGALFLIFSYIGVLACIVGYLFTRVIAELAVARSYRIASGQPVG